MQRLQDRHKIPGIALRQPKVEEAKSAVPAVLRWRLCERHLMSTTHAATGGQAAWAAEALRTAVRKRFSQIVRS